MSRRAWNQPAFQRERAEHVSLSQKFVHISVLGSTPRGALAEPSRVFLGYPP